MKKVQRSFAVEYKSGRRKSDANSKSIWGNVDLKSVARDVEEEAMSFPPHEQHGKSIEGIPHFADLTAKAMLTPLSSQHSSEAVKEETDMADENNAMTKTDAAAVVETPIAQKKQRKPRAKKIAPDATAVEAVSDKATGTPEKQKRGRKPKSTASAITARAPRVARDPKVVQAVPATSTASDEMADLLQLE
ncbi:MAG: transcriptional regulator, partial [Rhizobium sp.]|nr:transcriptional regulator [Rhizobium sp.]